MDTSNKGRGVVCRVANPNGVRFRREALVADINVVVSSRCVSSCSVSNRDVEAAGGVAKERTDPAGGVGATGGVVLEGLVSAGGVVCAGGVPEERKAPAGGYFHIDLPK